MYNILYLFVIFSSSIETKVPLMNYWDEGIVVFSLISLLFYSDKIIFKKKLLRILQYIVILVLIGVLSNWLHPEFQSSYLAIFKDIGTLIKFPMLMIVALNLKQSIEKNRSMPYTVIISKIIICVMIVFAIIGYFVDIGVYQDEIRLLKCYKFYYSHPTFLVFSIVMMISVLLCNGLEKNKIYLFLGAVLLILSGRSKAYIMVVFLMIVLLSITFFNNISINKVYNKLKYNYIDFFLLGFVLLVLSFFVLREKVLDYLAWGVTAARPALYIIGIELLLDCFPFGSGFGTFASSISGEHYSAVYNLYSLSYVNGLIEGNSNYIADTFWPYIYGQFGIFGMILYILILLGIFKYQYQNINNYNKLIGFIFAWTYALVACLAEAFFTNSTGVQLAVLLGMFIGKDNDKNIYVEAKSKSKVY